MSRLYLNKISGRKVSYALYAYHNDHFIPNQGHEIAVKVTSVNQLSAIKI